MATTIDGRTGFAERAPAGLLGGERVLPSPAPADDVRNCPLCDYDNRAEKVSRYSRDTWRIKACQGCGFHYLENPPGYAALEQEFAWERTSAAEADQRLAREPWLQRAGRIGWAINPRRLLRPKMLRLVDRYIGRGRVLDIGCGKGRQGASLGPGYVPFGIEISQQLAAGAHEHFRRRGGWVAACDSLSGLATFEPGFFDGLMMKSYLEHEAAPRPVLAAACQTLRPAGTLIVKVPNFASWNRHVRRERWCGFRFPDHVNYFTPKSLVALLRSTGFEIARLQFNDQLPWSDNLWVVARKQA